MDPPSAERLRRALGRAVRALRREAGYSQEGFADAIGVHRTYTGSLERGEVNVTFDNLVRVAAGLGYPPWALLLAADDHLADDVEPPAADAGLPSG